MLPYTYVKGKKYFKMILTDEETVKPDMGYVLAEDGLYYINENKGYAFVAKPGELPFDEIKPEMTCKFPPVSFKVYSEVLSFLRKVNDTHDAEGNVLLVLRKDIPFEGQEYKVLVPKQKVSSGSVDYTIDHEILEEGEFLAGSIHSHPTFGAYQSGIDHADEVQFEGIHITLGHIDRPDSGVECHVRFCFAGTTHDIPKGEHGDYISTTTDVEDNFPDDWMGKVEKETWGGGIYSYGGFYGGRRPETPCQHDMESVCNLVEPGYPALRNDDESDELIPFNMDGIVV